MKGGVITKVGNSVENKTGSWRTVKPIVTDKCTGCGICIGFCPEGIIELENKKAVMDYDFCKGCMICWKECPFNAIEKQQER